jgi:hypothetical protein
MTECKSDAIRTVVNKIGKSDDRVRAANKAFETFRSYAESKNVECETGRNIDLPNCIAEWLALIAGIGSTEEDIEHLTTVIQLLDICYT